MKPQQLDEGGSAALRSPERHLAVNARRSLGQCLKKVLARKLEMDKAKLTQLRAAMAISSTACLSIMLLVLATACAHAQITGEAETRKFVSCRTLVTWTGPQGTQVSYLGAGGKSYLWAPGSDTVLSGTWRVDPNATSPQSRLAYVAVCVQYGGSAQWDCRPAEILERITMDHADGDVFGLEGRPAVPLRLARDRTNIAMLQQRLRAETPEATQAPRPAAKCD